MAGSVYDLFNGQDPEQASLSRRGKFWPTSRRSAVHAGFIEQSKGLLGLFGRKELFSVSFRDRQDGKSAKFGDQELARLVKTHGDQIWGIYLDNTQVTDEGLRVLKDLTNLRHLSLEYSDPGIARRALAHRPD